MFKSGPYVIQLLLSKHSVLIFCLLSIKSHQPSGMRIHRQNSYVPPGKQRTSHREAQSREPDNKIKKKELVEK
jgi:hypothetical protein